MRAGRLRQRITLERATEVADAYGQPVATWRAAGTYWGAIELVGGRESVVAEQLQARVTHLITLRASDQEITTKDRLRLGSRVFGVTMVNDVEARGRELRILAEERA
jgi:SPP1 family predicted phage head-tail adaptor